MVDPAACTVVDGAVLGTLVVTDVGIGVGVVFATAVGAIVGAATVGAGVEGARLFTTGVFATAGAATVAGATAGVVVGSVAYRSPTLVAE